MTVSVIIPSYNHAKYLRQRIDSVLCQTFRDFELIILDDASTDNSREIIEEHKAKFPFIITSFNERNSGIPAIQWNKGINMAKGEFIWIAESDDYAENTFLERMLAEIQKSERVGMVFCDSRIQNQEKGIEFLNSAKKEWANRYIKTLTKDDLIENSIPNVSSVLFRKEAYVRSGMADTTLRFSADWLLYLNIERNWDIIYLPDALNTFRLHEGSSFHLHYKNNTFLSEKVSICRFIIRNFHLEFAGIIKSIASLTSSLVLRIIHLFHLQSYIMPELPRRPRKEHIKFLIE